MVGQTDWPRRLKTIVSRPQTVTAGQSRVVVNNGALSACPFHNAKLASRCNALPRLSDSAVQLPPRVRRHHACVYAQLVVRKRRTRVYVSETRSNPTRIQIIIIIITIINRRKKQKKKTAPGCRKVSGHCFSPVNRTRRRQAADFRRGESMPPPNFRNTSRCALGLWLRFEDWFFFFTLKIQPR